MLEEQKYSIFFAEIAKNSASGSSIWSFSWKYVYIQLNLSEFADIWLIWLLLLLIGLISASWGCFDKLWFSTNCTYFSQSQFCCNYLVKYSKLASNWILSFNILDGMLLFGENSVNFPSRQPKSVWIHIFLLLIYLQARSLASTTVFQY